MGYARNAGSGDKRSWFTLRRNTPKGAPVPGTGVRHFHKRRSGSNKSGALSKLNNEWGATARKQEDEQRGINNRARHQAIEDQVESFEEDESPVQYFFDELVEDAWADEINCFGVE